MSQHRSLGAEHLPRAWDRMRGNWRLVFVLLVLVSGITASELLLYVGRRWPSIWIHFGTLIAGLFLIQLDDTADVVQVLILVPVFRLVNLGMPVFFQLTVYWFPLIYGPLIPALVLVDNLQSDIEVPFGWRRGLLLLPLAVPLSAGLAQLEAVVISSEALIPTWSVPQVAMITVVMVGFVGFVEEYLFRGLLQGRLEAELGRWPGLLIASALFGLMHSGYGLPLEIVFASVIGLVFGLLYDYLDSLVFVTFAHGILNVFLFAVYPMHDWLIVL